MTAKSETKITKDIMDHIKKLGGDCFHVHGSMFQRSGEPDIDGCLPGNIHLKVEVKTLSGKPSKLQLIRLRKYHKFGYIVGIVTSVEEFDDLLAGRLEDKYKLYSP